MGFGAMMCLLSENVNTQGNYVNFVNVCISRPFKWSLNRIRASVLKPQPKSFAKSYSHECDMRIACKARKARLSLNL